MCCLFGLIDYGHSLSGRQKTKILQALALESEARGTDAAGIAYINKGMLRVNKQPGPAHLSRFRVPKDAWTVMGHTRLTTQGNARRNQNNHPFVGHLGKTEFALAHNGVLNNDKTLRQTLRLPKTRIETDSYVAVQLLEQESALDFSSLQKMAEQVQGTFVFTVLDHSNSLYFIRGDNPLCLLHFPEEHLYLYASTSKILMAAVSRIRGLVKAERTEISTVCGDILRIDKNGVISTGAFDTKNLWQRWFLPSFPSMASPVRVSAAVDDTLYWEELKSVAAVYGYTPEVIDECRELGFTTDEIEEMIYFGEI
ncbi:class II glutamine amidotransferase [Evtepia sp.]|uniref:class II glutamine amidotransferase n=1 Tax=Evtepia sp. TaxID=2773933 RepID=UPI003F17A421